jgi:ribosome biogenesis GTPase
MSNPPLGARDSRRGGAHALEDDVNDLSALGFGPFFEEQLEQLGPSTRIPARIAAEHRGGYEVWSATSTGSARLSGRLRHESNNATVGDWVLLRNAPDPHHTTVIDHVFDRRTVFTRGSAGRQTRAQIVAANIDQVFVVCGLDGDYSLHRIERYLARVWASGASPAVVLNKADLCDDPAAHVREVEQHAPGVPVFVTRALDQDGLPGIATTIQPGSTTAFVGSSGTGKSTLINALVGEARMATGATMEGDGRGRHTTTHRQLVALPMGGFLLDTPGMRELQLVDEDGLSQVFGDVDALATECRYRDCQHEHEPGCAVREAMEHGTLTSDRFQHYHQLKKEAQSYELRQDERSRRQADREFGRFLHTAMRTIKRQKGDR